MSFWTLFVAISNFFPRMREVCLIFRTIQKPGENSPQNGVNESAHAFRSTCTPFGVLARAAKVCYAHFAATRRNRVAFPASPKPPAGLDFFTWK
ncbi:hypothetical protein [Anaerolinea thermophila]|uniref:hypothetical protein n=1 Tax=Anaerolinea thermophila TaxID=167964 RepID=UPI0012DBCB2D|nr:hypothetical protein [Anaerolinea thermophila]